MEGLREELSRKVREKGLKLERKELSIIWCMNDEGRYVSIEEILEKLGESKDKYSVNALTKSISRLNGKIRKDTRFEIKSRSKIGYVLKKIKPNQGLSEEQIRRRREKARQAAEKKRNKAREIQECPSKEYVERMISLIDRTRGEKK